MIGTILEEDFLSTKENNFIFCIYFNEKENNYGISYVDISTGEFYSSLAKNVEEVKSIINKYSPNEIILNENKKNNSLISYIKSQNIYYNFLSEIRFNLFFGKQILEKQYNDQELKEIEGKENIIISSGALLFYIYKLQKLELTHLKPIQIKNISSSMIIDSISLRNLEILDSIFTKDKSKTLFGILDKTKTALGSRRLKNFLVNPLLKEKEINERLDAIEEFNLRIFEREQIRELLDEFYDIERIASRISTLIATPKDLESLENSLKKLPNLKNILQSFETKLIKENSNFSLFKEVIELIEKSIVKPAPSHLREIGYIKRDFDPNLKELFDIAFNSKNYLKELEEKERLSTGIVNLKIKYNKVFGYFIEIPKAQKSKVPENYIPTQTLANSQRYTTEELKEKEGLILGSEEKIKELEKEIYFNILRELKKYIKQFQELSKSISLIDVFSTLSYVSEIYNYSRPNFSKEKTEIIEGRNPIVERFCENYISNDCLFDENEKIKIITGPNMSGKSTYLRQIALISIMGQAGFFIPAKKATLKIYDRVFTRIGAYDELSEGHSTFMVEMIECANILNNATKNSLVLLDEIGRGTSTYDGLAIAWAIVERLNEIESDTIFATHYHQLNELETFYEKIVNYHVSIKEEEGKIEFIRKIEKGGTDKSYGIYVGQLAGIPKKVIQRAIEIQKNIENKEEILIKKEFKNDLYERGKKSKTDDSKKLDEFL
jgi:DNA mismatch repair protein MutS